jgi:hypothetical protein
VSEAPWTPPAGTLVTPPLPPDNSFGELELCYRRGTGISIVRADPRVRISGELIRAQFDGRLMPGARLVIHGSNRKAVYVIGAYHEATEHAGDWYEAEWPD